MMSRSESVPYVFHWTTKAIPGYWTNFKVNNEINDF